MSHFVAVRILLGMIALVLAAGCGGGGGASGPGPPLITGAPPSGATGVVYPRFTFTVASGGVAPYTWSETGAVPPGLSWSPAAPQLTGTPTTAGTYPLTIMVADSSTPPLTGTLSVNVQIVDSPIVVATAPVPPAGTVSYGYPAFAFSVASGGSPPFTWGVTSGALPPGLGLAGDGTLDGNPTTVGSSTFTVTATDGAAPARTGSQQFTITVSNPLPPTINNTPPPTATLGVPYSFQFTANRGLTPFVWSATGTMGGLGVDSGGVLSGSPASAGHFPIMVNLRDSLMQSAPSTPFTVRISLARPAAAFTSTGSMLFARSHHTATLLTTGQVLVAGGVVGSAVATAELYDTATAMFTRTMGDMTVSRSGHAATLLNDPALPNYRKVLIVGGSASLAAPPELFDPATGTFTATAPLAAPRQNPTSTLLLSGKVLIVGGNTNSGDLSAELYDPATGRFTSTGSTRILRIGHTATLLLDGRVLVAGGEVGVADASAELYDPATGRFTATGSMTVGRTGHTATRLHDGTVLVLGTDVSQIPTRATADVYDPGTGNFTAVGDMSADVFAQEFTASLRNDGTVLVVGTAGLQQSRQRDRGGRCLGFQAAVSGTNAEVFASESEGFTASGSLITPRNRHTATVLADGTVLIAGGLRYELTGSPFFCTGRASRVALSSAELVR
jgi:hypothetical protein